MKKKDLFSSQLDLLSVRLYCVTIVYDLIKFQIDLVILASLKNFVGRLHNRAFFFFSLDFALAFCGLVFFRLIYMATGFSLSISRKVCSGEREID